ncbi:DNA polymerase lambda [Cytospora mali]|uniref:DNA polymerase lambda n=1 Tax=Cytospora mali TaxID=578113 RepID=A0A194VAI2_CYTMA|nr:DNA polymerase lambda [Valsa mali var. pyri (nom. inval.)]
MSADIPLKDKEAFYAQIELLDVPSDEDDEVFQRDREVRARSRDFFSQAQPKTWDKVNSRKPSQTAHIDLTAPYENLRKSTIKRSKTAPTPTSARSAVIERTPSTLEQDKRVNRRRIPVSTSFVEDTPRPEPRPDGTPSLKRSATNPSSRPSLSRPSFPQATASLSNMAKRKREVVVPQDQKLLRGLRLFYIPGDRISLRKQRMEHAENYGAVVTQVLGDATHVVVDDGLTFEDIKDEEGMASVVGKDKPVLVREHWPIDSIANKRLLPTTYLKYRVKGIPTAETLTAPQPEERATSQASKKSLQLKAPSNNPKKWDYVPQHTQSQSERSSAPQFDSGEVPQQTVTGPDQGQRPDITAEPVIVPSSPDPSGGGETHPRPKNSRHRTGPDYEDELSQLIDDVQKNFKGIPALGDEDDDIKSEDKDGHDDSSQSGSEGEMKAKRQKILMRKSRPNQEDTFVCSRGGTKDQSSRGGPNAKVIAVLQQMLDYYTRTNDHWRIWAYRRVINTLSRQKLSITTAEQAITLPYIGKSLASKVEEIANTDRLQRLEYAQNDPTSQILKLFLGVYGVGTSTADKWIAQGFKTLDDLRQKGKLTPNQCIGLDHYDDLNSRIPRAEVEALGNYVKKEASRIDKMVELLIGGSYRRGADSSGDIDFIVTKKGTTSRKELNPFLDKLISNLTKQGFLTAELASHYSHGSRHHKDGNGSKWHGCCVLPRIPGSSNDNDDYRPVWRRIDILLVPETEYGAALIYFTGNDIFNRSIRLLASKKKMRLNQRGLYKDVMRAPGRDKLSEGELLEGRSERRIFEILGVKWREPCER